MMILKTFLKIVALPIMLAMTILQWFGTFLVGFSAVVFNILAGLFLLAAVLSYLMGLSAGPEVLKMILAGFVIFMIPVAGEIIVTAITAVSSEVRDFIRS